MFRPETANSHEPSFIEARALNSLTGFMTSTFDVSQYFLPRYSKSTRNAVLYSLRVHSFWVPTLNLSGTVLGVLLPTAAGTPRFGSKARILDWSSPMFR